MKRSQMTKTMVEYWFGLFPDENPKNMELDQETLDEVEYKMGELLDWVVHKGMLPPIRNADQKSDYGYARVYTWEKE